MCEKIFYLAFNDVGNKKNSGVAKKIKAQITGIKNNNFAVDYAFFKNDVLQFNNGKNVKFANKVMKKIFKYKYILKYIAKKNSDLIYIRYPMADMFFVSFLKKLKKQMNIKVLIEIPTYPYDFEFKKTNKFSIKYLYVLFDKFYRKKLKKYVDKIVTFSDHEYIFDIETLQISNGVILDNIPLAKVQHNKNRNKIHMISVSSLAYWHGVDRILKSLGEYYINKDNKIDIKLHIVGDGSDLKNLRSIVQKYKIEENVTFYGYKDGKDLDKIFRKSDIAIGCLANFRKNITKVKALKNIEYAARGLPMFYSEQNNDFDKKDFVYRVPHNESIIDLKKIIDFYLKLEVTPYEIREYVKNNLTWTSQMSNLFKILNNKI
ncbi:glycosyltransferase [Halanaerobium salsuginis]|uniref:Glycosyltransferase involved in cell wall bisynthesis n=1 Tax=Halanaerobium salsuginis TaxID=29563 RepID=A0A1I4HJB0_9FIRM|nr:glycosyltransferase [Halanaerobium salsuginis]SFL42398.1 Glycosyltransferase involved in cell wall bisynthesis [Halanaerobium salsuginis]